MKRPPETVAFSFVLKVAVFDTFPRLQPVAPRNRVAFNSAAEAEEAGYRVAEKVREEGRIWASMM